MAPLDLDSGTMHTVTRWNRTTTRWALRLAGSFAFVACLAALVAGCAGGARQPQELQGPADAKARKVCARYGIEIVSLRPSAADSMLDLRYRIVDGEKALKLVDRSIKAYLIDQATGRTVTVPNTAKIGPLRQTTKYGTPPEGRIFFMLFPNPGKSIHAGDKVTVVLGKFKAENLVVQ